MFAQLFQDLQTHAVSLLPFLVVLALVVSLLGVMRAFISKRRIRASSREHVWSNLTLAAASAVGVVICILTLPQTAPREALLSLFGVLLTAVIALSSTTFVSNAMAGLMLRAVRNFRPGDWISVGGNLGRVTEQGLFHVEIQTEDRDLTTLPNMLLVTQPVNVVRYSGTIVSATVSLGYDVPHPHVETLLLEAATDAGLLEPFVQVQELGDFSVTYRVAGLFEEVKHLITARSRLRAKMLDHLHRGGVEIVSPTFMVQRQVRGDDVVVPAPTSERSRLADGDPLAESTAEVLAFDKAEHAAELELLRLRRGDLEKQIESLRAERESADADRRTVIDAQVEARKHRIEAIDDELAAADHPD